MNKYIQKLYDMYSSMNNRIIFKYFDFFEHGLSEIDMLYLDPDVIINTLFYMYYQDKLLMITKNLWIIKMKDHHMVLVKIEEHVGYGNNNFIVTNFSLFTIIMTHKKNYNYIKNGNMNALTKLRNMKPFNFYIHKFFYFLLKPYGSVILTNFEELLLSEIVSNPTLRNGIYQLVINSVVIV